MPGLLLPPADEARPNGLGALHILTAWLLIWGSGFTGWGLVFRVLGLPSFEAVIRMSRKMAP